MMRCIIALGLTALAASAIAADLKTPPPPTPVYAWTGCYIGGNAGWVRAETRFRFDVDNVRHSADGFAGGGQIGCDYQLGSNWVVGIQGLVDAAGINNSHISSLAPGVTFRDRADWFATITGRLGFLVTPSFLIYGKVGWGAFDHRFTATDAATGVLISTEGRRNVSHPDAGAGFEWMFIPNWSLWVEWDHIFAEDNTVLFTPVHRDPFSENVRRDFDKVLFGVNWRFGGAVTARY